MPFTGKTPVKNIGLARWSTRQCCLLPGLITQDQFAGSTLPRTDYSSLARVGMPKSCHFPPDPTPWRSATWTASQWGPSSCSCLCGTRVGPCESCTFLNFPHLVRCINFPPPSPPSKRDYFNHEEISTPRQHFKKLPKCKAMLLFLLNIFGSGGFNSPFS